MAFSLSHYRKEYKQEVQDKLDQAGKGRKEARKKFQAWMQPMVDRVRALLSGDDGKPVYARCGWFRCPSDPGFLLGYRFVLDNNTVVEILPDPDYAKCAYLFGVLLKEPRGSCLFDALGTMHEFLVSVCRVPDYYNLAQDDAGEFKVDGSFTQAVGAEADRCGVARNRRVAEYHLDPCRSSETDGLDEKFLRDVAKLCEE